MGIGVTAGIVCERVAFEPGVSSCCVEESGLWANETPVLSVPALRPDVVTTVVLRGFKNRTRTTTASTTGRAGAQIQTSEVICEVEVRR
jgi:hypothetical protein